MKSNDSQNLVHYLSSQAVRRRCILTVCMLKGLGRNSDFGLDYVSGSRAYNSQVFAPSHVIKLLGLLVLEINIASTPNLCGFSLIFLWLHQQACQLP